MLSFFKKPIVITVIVVVVVVAAYNFIKVKFPSVGAWLP